MSLNNEWVNKEIKREIKKYLETNKNEHTTTQDQWNTAKAVHRGKFIAIQAYLKKIRESQINKNERGEVTADTKEIQKIVRKYYKQLYVNKLNDL